MTTLHVLMDANLVVTSLDEIQRINLKELYPDVKITIIYESLTEGCNPPELENIQNLLHELKIEVVHATDVKEPPSQIENIIQLVPDYYSALEVDYIIQTGSPRVIITHQKDHFEGLDNPNSNFPKINVWSLDRFKEELNALNGKSPELSPHPEPNPPVSEPPTENNVWKILKNKINTLLLMIVLLEIGIIVPAIIWTIVKGINIAQTKPQFFVGDDMSRGEEFLSPPKISEDKCKFQRQLDTEIKKATENFQAGEYEKAAQEFENGIDTAIKMKKNNPQLPIYNDPELRIYKENAKTRNSQDFLSIAVVVPIHKQERDGSIDYSTYCNRVRPILLGVAMAQEEINKNGLISIKDKHYYLEVVIANDRNDKDYKSKEIAQKIVQDKSILGIIGHNSSSATKAALEEYNGKIVVVTSTSTASDLGKDMKGMFYRAVASNQKLSERLADYLADKNIKNVAVVYENDDTYSKDYLQSFKDYSDKKEKGIRIIREIEFKQSKSRSPTGIIKENINFSVGAILHFTQTKDAQNFSLNLIRDNSKQAKPLLMLGGDSLYECDKLGKDSSGLILSVPWFKKANEASEKFNQKARGWPKIGGGDVNWRTATSYDATIAFAEAFAKYTNDDITRGNLGSKMQQVDLSAAKTSGEPLKFDKDIMPNPTLVKVVQNKNNKACGGYDFEKVDDQTVSNSP